MEALELLDTTFICPYMKIRLEAACSLNSCPYNSKIVSSRCIWDYVSSKKSISIAELALILNRNKSTLTTIVKNAKKKIIKEVINRRIKTSKKSLKYCYNCGKAFDLQIVKNEDDYRCRSACKTINCTSIETLASLYHKPASHILAVLAALVNIGTIADLLNISNKMVRDVYTSFFGDDTLLIRARDLKTSFKKRKKPLKFRAELSRRTRAFNLRNIERGIENFLDKS